MNRHGTLLTAAVALATLMLTPEGAPAQDVLAGIDCWETEPGSSAALPELPEGFFGDKNGTDSDTIPAQTIQVEGLPLPPYFCVCQTETSMEWVDIHGNPVEPGDIHAVRQRPVFDTCVERLDDVTFSGVGVPQTIDVEIVALSLKSVAPITVNFGIEPPSLYDVFIFHDGIQNMGMMEFTATQLNPPQGDTLLGNLPVNFQIIFQDIVDPIVQQQLPGGLIFQNTPGTFQPALIFTDGFESGDVLAWSNSVGGA